jgi:hypothetical protein
MCGLGQGRMRPCRPCRMRHGHPQYMFVQDALPRLPLGCYLSQCLTYMNSLPGVRDDN